MESRVEGYKKWIEDNLCIVNKQSDEVSFILNPIQSRYVLQDMSGRDVILKARQQGFSSVILAIFCADFLLKENSYNVVVADIDDNAQDLLLRVKKFIESYEIATNRKVPLKYNSKTELYNESMNSRYKIGTAQNTDFGRSKTITNLHFSESAYYLHLREMIAGAGQAVVEDGRFVLETTANGFNYFKTFWEQCKAGERPFKSLFYKASDFYSSEFLADKRGELKELYPQEYPETDIEAFLTSGELYFNPSALQVYLQLVKEPIQEGVIYV